MARTVVIVPIFWGSAWKTTGATIPGSDVVADIRSVAGSYYMAGLGDHGLQATPTVEEPIFVDAADSAIPNGFDAQDVWDFLDDQIDNQKTVPPPTNWDSTQFRVYYGIAIAPGHSNVNPNTFGQNNKDYRGQSAGYATANSDRAGVVTTFWHEVVEGASHDEIVDACRTDTFEANGVRVSRYTVQGRCWPWIDYTEEEVAAGPARREGPFTNLVEISDGICGTRSISYNVEYTPWRITAAAFAPGLDPSTFWWSIAGSRVMPGQSSVLKVNVQSSDPRPPNRQRPPQPTTATINVEEADSTLVFTTDPADGNYAVNIRVTTVASSFSEGTVRVRGVNCPELDEADEQCRRWLEDQTKKLDRDWEHWIDPSDPLVEIIRDRRADAEKRFLRVASAARELRALGRDGADEVAARVAEALGVDSDTVLGNVR